MHDILLEVIGHSPWLRKPYQTYIRHVSEHSVFSLHRQSLTWCSRSRISRCTGTIVSRASASTCCESWPPSWASPTSCDWWRTASTERRRKARASGTAWSENWWTTWVGLHRPTLFWLHGWLFSHASFRTTLQGWAKLAPFQIINVNIQNIDLATPKDVELGFKSWITWIYWVGLLKI